MARMDVIRLARRAISLALSAALVTFFSGVSAGSPAPAKTIRIASLTELSAWDSIPNVAQIQGRLTSQVFEPLVAFDMNMKVVPYLVEGWTKVDDLTWDLRVRPNVLFHNGRELTAEDVGFSIERTLDPATTVPQRPFGTKGEIIEGVESVDKYRVRVKLVKPWGPFLESLTSSRFGVVPKKEFLEAGARFGKSPETTIGTGPFRLVAWQRDSQAVLRAFDKHWLGKPSLDSVVVRIIPDPSVAALELQQGNIDILTDVNPDQYKALRNRADVKIESSPTPWFWWLIFNVSPDASRGNPKRFGLPLTDVRVRRAIAHAVNRDAIVRVLAPSPELGFRLDCYVPKGPYFSPECEKLIPKYDPKEARRLLAEAGYQDRLELEIIWWNKQFEAIPTLVQSYLLQAGVRAKINFMEVAPFVSRVNSGDFEIAVLQWGLTSGSDFFLRPFTRRFFGVQNRSRYTDPEVEPVIDKAFAESNEQKRVELFRQAYLRVMQDLPYLPIFQLNNVFAYRTRVEGLKVFPPLQDLHLWSPYGKVHVR